MKVKIQAWPPKEIRETTKGLVIREEPAQPPIIYSPSRGKWFQSWEWDEIFGSIGGWFLVFLDTHQRKRNEFCLAQFGSGRTKRGPQGIGPSDWFVDRVRYRTARHYDAPIDGAPKFDAQGMMVSPSRNATLSPPYTIHASLSEAQADAIIRIGELEGWPASWSGMLICKRFLWAPQIKASVARSERETPVSERRSYTSKKPSSSTKHPGTYIGTTPAGVAWWAYAEEHIEPLAEEFRRRYPPTPKRKKK